jgi:G3E family GTPase
VVDVERYQEMQADVAPLLRRQVQMADVMILNKTDVVSQAQIEQTRDELVQLNSHARIEVTAHCEVNCGALWQHALLHTHGDSAPRVLGSDAGSEAVPHTHFQTVIFRCRIPSSALVLKRRCKACHPMCGGPRVSCICAARGCICCNTLEAVHRRATSWHLIIFQRVLNSRKRR